MSRTYNAVKDAYSKKSFERKTSGRPTGDSLPSGTRWIASLEELASLRGRTIAALSDKNQVPIYGIVGRGRQENGELVSVLIHWEIIGGVSVNTEPKDITLLRDAFRTTTKKELSDHKVMLHTA